LPDDFRSWHEPRKFGVLRGGQFIGPMLSGDLHQPQAAAQMRQSRFGLAPCEKQLGPTMYFIAVCGANCTKVCGKYLVVWFV
jgi:hypothetical protein